MLRVKRSVQAAFSTVNYNAAEMGVVPKVDTLTEESAMQMIAEREDVEVDNMKKPLIGGFVSGKKRNAEVEGLSEVERRAARLRQVTCGGGDGVPPSGGSCGGDDEIDLDVDEEEEHARLSLP